MENRIPVSLEGKIQNSTIEDKIVTFKLDFSHKTSEFKTLAGEMAGLESISGSFVTANQKINSANEFYLGNSTALINLRGSFGTKVEQATCLQTKSLDEQGHQVRRVSCFMSHTNNFTFDLPL